MQQAQPTKLIINRLLFERNNKSLFNQIHCELEAGTLLQIHGKNGSGKSTLLRILAGFIEPQEGSIQWQGKSIFQQKIAYQQQLHYIGHLNGIKSHLTVYENVKLNAALILKKVSAARINTILQDIGLGEAAHIKALNLSAGQQRRLALGKLLLHPTSLWLLDEPTTALDKNAQFFLSNLLNQHLIQGGIAIIATHQSISSTGNTKVICLEEKHV